MNEQKKYVFKEFKIYYSFNEQINAIQNYDFIMF